MSRAADQSSTIGLTQAAGIIASDIKLAHSVFALPFAILAAFMAFPQRPSPPWRESAIKLVLIVVCMFFARTWAMLVNRLADRTIDAGNERTKRRAFASGRLSARTGWTAAAGCAAAFIGVASLFWFIFSNMWPPLLAAPVLAWIAFYSFTKRFTALCHLFLGGALAASPLAAAIAVDPRTLSTTPSLWFLAGFVLMWVAGFDVIYALADEEFDRCRGLNSIPARLGWRRAIWASRALHALALALLIGAWRWDPRFGLLFGVGVAIVACLLMLEHSIVARRGKAGLDMAFFTVNGIVSCVLGAVGCLDVLTRA
ncbi:MAG: 4-hydroxybenzoate octaprenyltransferase [Planctomycetes bacterium]|nr:4-hydroxybenzoate octaprenyltransferase [Planctomycetota bacterium]